MIGTTGLTDLRVVCIVGIHEHERRTPQTVALDLEFDYDFAPAARSESIADALDYDRAARLVAELLERRAFQLIETMAEETASLLLAEMRDARVVRITIRKPAAVPAAACSFVRVERARA